MSTPETPQPTPTPTPETPRKPQRGFMIMMAVLGLAFGLPTVYSGGVMVGGAFGSGEFPSIGFLVQLGFGLALTGFGLAALWAVILSFTERGNGDS
ncbi:hypothetical protein [Maricaulis sp.]|uniref:hypothetical protein n=1 Tax=Maricaulis sp. TaxID=1486257 RepID=UPI002B267748|nr:hypothetical protein [Maricaulis sp.]